MLGSNHQPLDNDGFLDNLKDNDLPGSLTIISGQAARFQIGQNVLPPLLWAIRRDDKAAGTALLRGSGVVR